MQRSRSVCGAAAIPNRRVGRLVAVVGDPVVVGARLGLGEVEVGAARDAEELGRVDDRLLDVVLRHLDEAPRGVERARADVRITHLALERALALLERHAARARERHPVRVHLEIVVEAPLGAGGVGLDVEAALLVALGHVLEHRGRVLEDVAVGVDDARAGRGDRGHGGLLRRSDARQPTLIYIASAMEMALP